MKVNAILYLLMHAFFPDGFKGFEGLHYCGRGHLVVSQSCILQTLYYGVWDTQLFPCFIPMPPR